MTPSRQKGKLSITGWLLLGLVLGLAGSLYYAWVVAPVVFTDASPARFSDNFREEYVQLVSESYAVSGDWLQAEQRLLALEEPDLQQTVANLLDDAVRTEPSGRVIRNLAALASRLGVEGAAVAQFGPSNGAMVTPTPSPTETAVSIIDTQLTPPTPSTTPPPTLPKPTATIRPSATPIPNYRLLNQQPICRDEAAPRIEVNTLDAFLDPEPGVEVIVRWQGGEDHFFTGFKPQLGAGYGDFTMSPEVSYTVMLAAGSQEVSGLRIEPCESGFVGGWELTFQNLRIDN